MIEEAIVIQHRILKIAELRQRVLDEMRQRAARLSLIGGIPERAQGAETVAKSRLDQIKHLFHRVVRCEFHRAVEIDSIGRGFAVVVVEIPLAACGLTILHQQAGFAPHLAIEILHPQRFAPLGPIVEFIKRRHEPRVRMHGQLQRHILKRVDQPPFTALGGDHLFRAGFVRAAQQFTRDRTAIIGVVQLGIADVPPIIPQPRRKLAHGCKDQGDFLRVMLNIGRLVRDLGHHDDVLFLVRIFQRRQIFRQLIPKDQNKTAHHGISFLA